MIFDPAYALEILPSLLRACLVTLLAAVSGMVFALLFGFLVAIVRAIHLRPLDRIAAAYVEFIRSTPLLIQLYFLFFVLPHWHIRLSAPMVALAGLGLYYATFVSEVYRAGINSVPRSQWEAAVALNFSERDTWLRIILPQAIPPIVPNLSNYLIAMFKDTPLLAAIGVQELLGMALTHAGVNYRYVEPLTIVGVLFLALSWPSALLARKLETTFNATH